MSEAPDQPAFEAPRDAAVERRRMRAATAMFAVATTFSRIAGLVRQVVVSAMFGATEVLAAFTVASQIPNLLRALVADAALSAAFVPAFTELTERGERERAWSVASTFISLILVVLGPLVVLAMVLAPQLVSVFGFTGSEFDLAVDLTRIMMPIVVLMACNGVIVGILNSHDHFTAPAIAPILWNAAILLSLVIGYVWLPESTRIYAYAVGMLSGTLIQVVYPMPWLRGLGGRLRLRMHLRDPRVGEILLLMLPVTISLGLINLQQVTDSIFSTHVPARLIPAGVELNAGPAVLENAFRVYMLPQGIFSVAISTVLFPALSRFAARSDDAGFRDTFASGLRQIFLLLVPCALFLGLLAEPVVRLLYQRGEFTPAQTGAVSGALAALSIGLVFNGASLLAIRAFFAQRQTWLPTGVSVLTLVVNVAVNLYAYDHYGVTGIAATTSIVNVVGFGALYVLLQRRVGRLGTRRTLVYLLGTVVAGVVACGLARWLWELVDGALGRGLGAQLAAMAIAGAAAGTTYIVIILRLRLIDRATLVSLLKRGKGTP